MSDINRVLSCLDKVKSRGQDKWLACCPAHNDSNPSLSIALKDDRVLFKCWAGCGGLEIMEAIGLPTECYAPRDLFKNPEQVYRSVFGVMPKQEKSTEDYVLAIAKSKRASGERLTAEEKEAELNAWKRKRKAI